MGPWEQVERSGAGRWLRGGGRAGIGDCSRQWGSSASRLGAAARGGTGGGETAAGRGVVAAEGTNIILSYF